MHPLNGLLPALGVVSDCNGLLGLPAPRHDTTTAPHQFSCQHQIDAVCLPHTGLASGRRAAAAAPCPARLVEARRVRRGSRRRAVQPLYSCHGTLDRSHWHLDGFLPYLRLQGAQVVLAGESGIRGGGSNSSRQAFFRLVHATPIVLFPNLADGPV